jgi:glycosyltransferase involved in cell wall biosynthesis
MRILSLEDEPYLHHLRDLESIAEVARIPKSSNLIRSWIALLAASRESMRANGIVAIHAHGGAACWASALALPTGDRAPFIVSPHGTRIGISIAMARQSMVATVQSVLVARSLFTKGNGLGRAKAVVVDRPVVRPFFEVQKVETLQPLILGSGAEATPRDIATFAEFAVLFGGELDVNFRWLGSPTSSASNEMLEAARAGVTEISSDEDCATKLAEGWIYIASNKSRGFPLSVAQAMAIGLPCVAVDCAQHRAVIAHGENGFLCSPEHDMLGQIAALIDDALLRERIGKAARSTALMRFSEADFDTRLSAIYSIASSRPRPDNGRR